MGVILLLIVLGLIFVPAFVAAFLSLSFKLLFAVFKLAFTFWQVTLFVLFIMAIAALL